MKEEFLPEGKKGELILKEIRFKIEECSSSLGITISYEYMNFKITFFLLFSYFLEFLVRNRKFLHAILFESLCENCLFPGSLPCETTFCKNRNC